MLDEAADIADEGIQGAVRSQPAQFKDNLNDQSNLMKQLRKRKRINNNSTRTNRTRTNINNNNNNNNNYTTCTRRRTNLARGTPLVNPRDVNDTTDDPGDDELSAEPLTSNSGYTAEECIEAVNILEDIISGPFADPEFDLKGDLKFRSLNDALSLSREDIRYNPHMVAFEAINALDQGTLLLQYLAKEDWKLPAGLNVQQNTTEHKNVQAPFGFNIVFKPMLHRFLFKSYVIYLYLYIYLIIILYTNV